MMNPKLTDTQVCIRHLFALDRAFNLINAVATAGKMRRHIAAEDFTRKLYDQLDGAAAAQMRRWNLNLEDEQCPISLCLSQRQCVEWRMNECELYTIADGPDAICPTCRTAKALFDARRERFNDAN